METLMQYGCIGEHLPHSFSQIIHNKIGSYDYILQELTPDALDGFMRARAFSAINVTIPYKEKVIPYLDTISESARAIGAVNTIVNRDGKLHGYNTDFIGMRMLLQKIGVSLAGKTVLILGTGGTGKTARAVATDGGAARIFTAGRSPRAGIISYDEAYAMHDEVQVIINTTPCGMFPNIDGAAIDLTPFTALEGVLDAVYNPLNTDLILQAKSRGIPAAGGLYMLVAQAVAASEIFLNCIYPTSLTDTIFRDILQSKQNIVLIGMPSSGKTSVGTLLSEKTGKALFDTDEEVRKAAGATPAELIETRGIQEFRAIESEVVHTLAREAGMVVATGGGAILAKKNVVALKKNGVLVFLNRPLEKLITTSDRPLSSTPEKLRALYAERLPLYRAAADITVDGSGTPEDVAEAVLAALS